MNNLQIFSFILLILVDLALTASRRALLSIRYGRMETLREHPDPKLQRTIELISQRNRLRATFKLAQSVSRFLIAGLLIQAYLPTSFSESDQPILLVLFAIAILLWLFELLIERVILRNPEGWAVRLTPLARFFVTALSPALRLIKDDEEGQTIIHITEQELISLVNVSERAGEIEKDESEMIYSVFQFGDTIAREIMVPRVDMLTLDVHTPLDQAADILLESGYSRVPVVEDTTDNIIGLLYTKDMLKVWRDGGQVQSLRQLLREANFIPESKKVDELLDEMQAQRTHIAIVVDEFGGVSGLVTLEDIIEEIFGEIQDEYDDGEEELATEISSDEYVFHGRAPLDQVNYLMNTELDAPDADTLGGLIYIRLGRVPRIGEIVQEDGLALKIEQVVNRRIRRIRATKQPITEEAHAD